MPNTQDIDLIYQPNTVKVLHALRQAAGPASIRKLSSLSGLTSSSTSNALIELLTFRLAEDAQVIGSDRRHFRVVANLPNIGTAELVTNATEQSRAQPNITPPRSVVHGENGYQGHELGCTVTRPGSMDACKLPSLFMGQRRHRDGRIFEGVKP
jgi:hypothetical protein